MSSKSSVVVRLQRHKGQILSTPIYRYRRWIKTVVLLLIAGVIIWWCYLYNMVDDYMPNMFDDLSMMPGLNDIHTPSNINNIYPINIWQLNKQQFCSANMNDQRHIKLLNDIYRLQFSTTCDLNNKSNTYLIYQIEIHDGSGLGATLNSVAKYFLLSLHLNYTFLFNGQLDWTIDVDYCHNKIGFNCYLMPISNCDPITLLSQVNTTQYLDGSDIEHHSKNNHYSIIHITTHPGNRYRIEELLDMKLFPVDMNKIINKTYNMLYLEWYSIFVSFILRPSIPVRDIIDDKLRRSKPFPIVSWQTVSIPIRASDKCRNLKTKRNATYIPEAEVSTCWEAKEWVLLMNAIKYFTNSQIDTVILTSEDQEFLNDVIDMMQNETISKVDNWAIITNILDFSVGEGTASYRETKNIGKYSHGQSLDKDHIVSALASLLLQIHLESEYMVKMTSSSWTNLIWNLMAFMDCNHDEYFKLKNESKCISVYTPGYVEISNYTYVEFSRDIFEKIHDENLEPDLFYNKFKIHIGDQGWNRWCRRCLSPNC
eukprot:366220_1